MLPAIDDLRNLVSGEAALQYGRVRIFVVVELAFERMWQDGANSRGRAGCSSPEKGIWTLTIICEAFYDQSMLILDKNIASYAVHMVSKLSYVDKTMGNSKHQTRHHRQRIHHDGAKG